MTWAWALYALVTATLFAGAGWAGEQLLARLGRPRRWAWAAAVAGTVIAAPALVAALELTVSRGSPPSGALLPAGAGAATGGGPAPWGVGVAAGEALRTGRRLLVTLDPWAAAGWAALSLAYFIRVAESWRRIVVDSTMLRDEGEIEIRTTRDRGPAALGWRRARILLPRWFFELEERDRTMVLEHEREHVRAGDHRLLLAATVLLGLAPWNPALWWAVRRLRDAVEMDCDRRLTGSGFDRVEYARLLLESEKRIAGAGPPFAAAASESHIGRRIRSLLRPGPPGGGGMAAVGAAGLGLCLAATALAADRFHASGALSGLPGRGASPDQLSAARGLRCREVADAGFRTDVIVRLRRTRRSDRVVVTLREAPDLEPGAGRMALAVGAPGSGPGCSAGGRALRVDLAPRPPDDEVRMAVSSGARVRVLDELTGRTASVSTRTPGETRIRCEFGPRDRFTCRDIEG